MRIFLVENHPVTLACVRRHLERLGHEVETAESVADTLRELPSKPRDLLIADLGLPDGDGCALLESLGSTRRTASTRSAPWIARPPQPARR